MWPRKGTEYEFWYWRLGKTKSSRLLYPRVRCLQIALICTICDYRVTSVRLQYSLGKTQNFRGYILVVLAHTQDVSERLLRY